MTSPPSLKWKIVHVKYLCMFKLPVSMSGSFKSWLLDLTLSCIRLPSLSTLSVMLMLPCSSPAFPDLLNLHLLPDLFLWKEQAPPPPPYPCVSNIHHCISTCLSSTREGSRYDFLPLTGVKTTVNHPSLWKFPFCKLPHTLFFLLFHPPWRLLGSARAKVKSHSSFHECKSKETDFPYIEWCREELGHMGAASGVFCDGLGWHCSSGIRLCLRHGAGKPPTK